MLGHSVGHTARARMPQRSSYPKCPNAPLASTSAPLWPHLSHRKLAPRCFTKASRGSRSRSVLVDSSATWPQRRQLTATKLPTFKLETRAANKGTIRGGSGIDLVVLCVFSSSLNTRTRVNVAHAFPRRCRQHLHHDVCLEEVIADATEGR
jgi:hypothetical protein